MNRHYVTQTVIETAQNIIGRTVDEAARFETIGFDSLECIEFTVAIEDVFGVEISCAERVTMEGVEDAVTLVMEKTRQDVALAA